MTVKIHAIADKPPCAEWQETRKRFCLVSTTGKMAYSSYSTTCRSPLIMKLAAISLLGGLCLSLLAGCAQYENKRGVEVTWEAAVTDHFIRGQSSRRDVLSQLGPPSQVISLEEETVLYYLFERSEGNGIILIVYNRMKIDTRYDRAIFFFDENDVLTDFATRIDEAART